MSKKTDYKQLWKRAVKECMQLKQMNDKAFERLSETTKLLVVIKDLVEEFVPEDKREDFKKQLDNRVKKAKLDIKGKTPN